MTLEQIDKLIERYLDLRRLAHIYEMELQDFVKTELLPAARKQGYRRGQSILLAGSQNSLQLVREAFIQIANQEEARKLPLPWRQKWLKIVFKPSEILRSLILFPDQKESYPVKLFKQFRRKAVRVTRRWRVNRVNLQNKEALR
jgi:hypothetical protein